MTMALPLAETAFRRRPVILGLDGSGKGKDQIGYLFEHCSGVRREDYTTT
jgi:hypothetical protein